MSVRNPQIFRLGTYTQHNVSRWDQFVRNNLRYIDILVQMRREKVWNAVVQNAPWGNSLNGTAVEL